MHAHHRLVDLDHLHERATALRLSSKKMKFLFSRYLTYKKDNNQLLKFILDGMVREQIKYGQYTGKVDFNGAQRISIEMDEFEAQARELGIQDVSEFYSSEMFNNSFTRQGAQIIKVFE